MIKYILEIIYHYSTALTSWSWTKLYGDRNKKMKTIPDTIDSIKKKIRNLNFHLLNMKNRHTTK